MILAKVDSNGIIIDCIVNDELIDGWVECPEHVGIGMDIKTPCKPYVPKSLTPVQARIALNNAGLRTQVDNAVSSADQNTKDYWEFATSIDRNNPILISMATSLGITSEQVDQLFIEGAKI